MSDDKNFWVISAAILILLIIPVVINFVIQISTDYLNNKRKTNLLTNEKNQEQLLFDTAKNKAKAAYAPQIVEQETKFNIDSILKKNEENETHIASLNEIIDHKSNAIEQGDAHVAALTKEAVKYEKKLEELEAINVKLDVELKRYKSEYDIIDKYVKELRNEN
jgi:hypothetical protein